MHLCPGESQTIFIPAAPDYYATWVQSHLLAGGHVDEFRGGYPADGKNILYATEDFELNNETGAASKSIIVPEYVTPSGQIGHNKLYLFEGPKAVNVYSVAAWATPEFAEFSELLVPDFNRIVRKALASAEDDDDEFHDSDEGYDPVQSTLEFYGGIAVKLSIEAPSL